MIQRSWLQMTGELRNRSNKKLFTNYYNPEPRFAYTPASTSDTLQFLLNHCFAIFVYLIECPLHYISPRHTKKGHSLDECTGIAKTQTRLRMHSLVGDFAVRHSYVHTEFCSFPDEQLSHYLCGAI